MHDSASMLQGALRGAGMRRTLSSASPKKNGRGAGEAATAEASKASVEASAGLDNLLGPAPVAAASAEASEVTVEATTETFVEDNTALDDLLSTGLDDLLGPAAATGTTTVMTTTTVTMTTELTPKSKAMEDDLMALLN